MSDISKNIRLRLEQLLPAILRMKSYEGSEIFKGPVKRMIGPTGLSSTFAGTMVAYYYIDAGEYLEHGNIYYTKIRSNEGSGWSDWIEGSLLSRANYPNWVDFVFNPTASGNYHFQLEVYSDEAMQNLEFSADSSVDQLGWNHVDTSILEKILYPLGMEAEVTESEIKALETLLSIDIASPMLLQYIAMTLGSMIDESDPIEYSRWLVRNIVDVWKMKGTRHSWRYGWLKKRGQDMTVKELWKTTPEEVGDYDWEEDATHDIRAARIYIGSCETICETGDEFAPWSYDDQVAALREVNEYRPIHVIIPLDILSIPFSETIEPYEDNFDATVAIDWRDNMEFDEEILINVHCIVNCETSCQSCCETTCEFSTCELNCQTGCEQHCENQCEGNCQSASQVGCQQACESQCQFACEAFCEWPCENACQIFESEAIPEDVRVCGSHDSLLVTELACSASVEVDRPYTPLPNPLWCALGSCQIVDMAVPSGPIDVPGPIACDYATQGFTGTIPKYDGTASSSIGNMSWANPDAGEYAYAIVPCGRAFPSFSLYQDDCDKTILFMGDGLAAPDCWMYRISPETLKLHKNVEVNGELFTTYGRGDIETRLAALEDIIASYPADLDLFPNNLSLLTAAEVTQLTNIGSNVINNTQWGRVASMQDVSTGASPDFAAITIASDYGIDNSGIATVAQLDGYDSSTTTTYTGYNGACATTSNYYMGVPYS